MSYISSLRPHSNTVSSFPVSPRRLGKKSRTHENPTERANQLLSSFGFDLTNAQLIQLELTLKPGPDPSVFSKDPKKKKRTGKLWGGFSKRAAAKKAAKEKLKNEPKQSVNLREIEICEQLGCGGSSAGVYLCIVDGWACAMKQLKRELVCKLDIQCFEREMNILYNLPPHPNIVRYLFHTADGKDLCLFMQLYSGTLREFLDERRKTQELLEAEFIAEMAIEIANGIEFLHKHNVIHRDIKSGNIFVLRNEKEEVTNLAVGDFDTSLQFQADSHLKSQLLNSSHLFDNVKARSGTEMKRDSFAQCKAISTVGTTGFMAPEVLRAGSSNTPYSFSADIYSFGMVLYEMITLKLPFEQVETCDIITAVLDGEETESMEIDQNVRKKYWQLVELHRKCTSHREEERPEWKAIILTLQRLAKEGVQKPCPLLPEKSKMSLHEQLDLYHEPRNSVMESIESGVNFLPDLPPLSSRFFRDSTNSPLKNSDLRYGGRQIVEEGTESSEHEEIIQSAIPMTRARSTTFDREEYIHRDQKRSQTRKVITEIKDTEGNVIREEIGDTSGHSYPKKKNKRKKKPTGTSQHQQQGNKPN